MSRKRTVLPHALEAEIAARTARGEPAITIHSAIGGALSVATIARRQRELKGHAKPKRIAPTKTPAPAPDPDDVPEDLPANTPVEQLDGWIARLEKGAAKAEDDGNLAALASIAAKVTALMALRHRSMPLPKADPNEAPDMIAMAEKAEELLAARIRALFHDGEVQG